MATAPRRLSGKKYGYDPGGGEANTASSLGGTSLVGTKSGVDLPFKGLSKDISAGATSIDIPYRFINGSATGTDTYAMTSGLSLVEADLDGMMFAVSFANANTGAATLNVDSIGAKSIVKEGSTALAASDLSATRYYILAYDGTNFQVVNVISGATGISTNKGMLQHYAGASASISTTVVIGSLPYNATVTGVRMMLNQAATVTANDTNYWTVSCAADTTGDGNGDTQLLEVTDANTTKATGGSTWEESKVINFTLTSTTANLDLNADDVIFFTFTETGSATTAQRYRIEILYESR